MPNKASVNMYTVRYVGLFDFDGMYAAATDWAKNFGYLWHEFEYKHKVPDGVNAEQEIQWDLTKKVTDYIKYHIHIYFHVFEMSEIEVKQENGKTKRLTKARIKIEITPHIIWDWQNTFIGKGKFAAKLGAWYSKLWSKDFESIYGDQIHYRAMNLQALFKKYLDLQSKKYTYKTYLGDG